jgi:hypothetical protein
MKRLITLLGGFFLLMVLTFLLLRANWYIGNKKVLNVFIVDKTVKDANRIEHKSFFWLLNQGRYVQPSKVNYSYKEDYFGFFPIDVENEVFDFKSFRISEIDAYTSNYDLAYFTDCYGVYSFEWYKGKTKPIRSQKVFGGLNQNDYLLMRSMLEKGKTVVSEYNILGTPTNSLIRSKTEALFGMNWSGWAGKYFSSLNPETNGGPEEWMKNLYESQHMGAWPTENAGIILLSNDGIIELLIDGIHLDSPLPLIVTNDTVAKNYGVSSQVPFEQWFEFIDPLQNRVISNFTLNVTEKGKATLDLYSLEPIFPAVIASSGSYKYYYFCGDFAENPAYLFTSKLTGGKAINFFLSRFKNSNKAGFFRYYYTPLMNTILKSCYSPVKEMEK